MTTKNKNISKLQQTTKDRLLEVKEKFGFTGSWDDYLLELANSYEEKNNKLVELSRPQGKNLDSHENALEHLNKILDKCLTNKTLILSDFVTEDTDKEKIGRIEKMIEKVNERIANGFNVTVAQLNEPYTRAGFAFRRRAVYVVIYQRRDEIAEFLKNTNTANYEKFVNRTIPTIEKNLQKIGYIHEK